MSAVMDYLESLRVYQRLTERGRPPSIREFQVALGLASTSASARRIERLAELGWIEDIGERPGESRAYVLSARGREALGPMSAPGEL